MDAENHREGICAYCQVRGIDRIWMIAFNATGPIVGGLNMCRIIAAFFLVLASAVTASAQGLFPSIWQTQRGAVLKVLSVDPPILLEISAEFSSPVQEDPVREFLIIWLEAFVALGWSSRRRGTGHQIAT